MKKTMGALVVVGVCVAGLAACDKVGSKGQTNAKTAVAEAGLVDLAALARLHDRVDR